MTSSAMPCRAALATSAGTIRSTVELLRTAKRNGVSGSSDLPLCARLGNGLGQLRQLIQIQSVRGQRLQFIAPADQANSPRPSASRKTPAGARGSHSNSA